MNMKRANKLVLPSDEEKKGLRMVVSAKGNRDAEEASLDERIASGEFDDSGSTKEKMTRPLRKLLAKEPLGIGTSCVKEVGMCHVCLMDNMRCCCRENFVVLACSDWARMAPYCG
jgi:hypothetical protein